MHKHSPALILPYYGALPNYFPLWLKTAGYNPGFTFMIFSDEDFSSYNIPANVKVFLMTFDEIKARIKPHLDFDFVLHSPYKLCDYRPLYGLIFQDYLEGYDFWGYSDFDIIWGDLAKFVTQEMLDKYDRLYVAGHFTLYRNTEKIRTFILHESPDWDISYKDAYRTKISVIMDEYRLADKYFSMFGDEGGGYALNHVANMRAPSSCFKLGNTKLPALLWKNGGLFGISINGDRNNQDEYMYAHFQKRRMNYTPGLEKENSFMIIPNEFVKTHELTDQEIKNFMIEDPEYEIDFKRKYIANFDFKKDLITHIKLFFARDYYGKIVGLKRRWHHCYKYIFQRSQKGK